DKGGGGRPPRHRHRGAAGIGAIADRGCVFLRKFPAGAAGRRRGNTGTEPRNAARNAIAPAGRGTLLPRTGAVVLQHAVAATRGAGCELAVHARSDGRRRHRRHADSGDGGYGGNTLGAGLGRPIQKSATLPNHRHGLAQDKPAGSTAAANLGSGLYRGRRAARPAQAKAPATEIAVRLNGLTTAPFSCPARTVLLGPHPRQATESQLMPPTIRPARADEYDEVARVWMDSWVSTGFGTASEELLGQLRARIPAEIAGGWSLYVADDNGRLAAMLALHVPNKHLDQLFVAPQYHGRSIGRRLRACTRKQLPDEIWLRCVRENEKAWRWYEREGFVYEREAVSPITGHMMKYYRWKKEGTAP